MRPLEISLLLSIALILGWYLLAQTSPSHLRVFPVFSLFLLVGQVALEGQRWQMWPAYLVSIWLFVHFIRPHPLVPGRWMILSGLVLLIAAGTIATLLPVFKLPIPTGPFPIGTVRRHLVDLKRQETQGNEGGGYRELMVQIWYPAASSGPPSPYRLPSETTLRGDRLALVKTHSAVGVPVSNARPRYPVILYSPSWQGSRNENVAYVEELASHGFVVVGIDHTYGTDLTFFPDGRVIRSNLVNFIDCSSDLAYYRSLREVNEQLHIRVSDVRFVLCELERFDKEDPAGLFTSLLNLDRLGVFGYSFGGAVAMEACQADSRFRAGIALDSLLFGKSADVGVEQPFLFLTDDSPIPNEEDLQVADGTKRRQGLVGLDCVQSMRRSIAEHGGYWIIVRGTKHPNFSDSALYQPLKRRTGVGPIDASRATRIVNQCVLSFFERFLNDCPSCSLENICARTPELNLVQSASPKGRTNPSHVP